GNDALEPEGSNLFEKLVRATCYVVNVEQRVCRFHDLPETPLSLHQWQPRKILAVHAQQIPYGKTDVRPPPAPQGPLQLLERGGAISLQHHGFPIQADVLYTQLLQRCGDGRHARSPVVAAPCD